MNFVQAAFALSVTSAFVVAEEKKDTAPRITAIAPLHLVAGESQTLRLRGSGLKEVTELRTKEAAIVVVKEKKDSAVPNGLEAKDVGDQELIAEVQIPADFGAPAVEIAAVSPAGTSAARSIPIVKADSLAKEKEPNNGFREAQVIDPRKPVVGRVEQDKDVDVFQVEGHTGVPLHVRITASEGGSLLDPILSIYDGTGRLLSTVDDAGGKRDARLSLTPASNGPLCIVVSDAHDRGGTWHDYQLHFDAD